MIALHDSGAPSAAISRTIASVHDTITRRLIELAQRTSGGRRSPYTWLAMGSFGRREPFPSSDVDCALAWEGANDDRGCARRMRTLAGRVLEGLSASGLAPDEQGAVATSPLFAHSIERVGGAARVVARGPRTRPRPDAALGGGRERPGLGRDGRGRAHRGRVRPDSQSRARAQADRRRGAGTSVRPPASCATSCSRTAGSARACSTSSTAACCRSSRSRAGPVSPPASAQRRRGPPARPPRRPARWTPADAAVLRDVFELHLRAADGAPGRAAARGQAARQPDRSEAPHAADQDLAEGGLSRGGERAARDRGEARPHLALSATPGVQLGHARRGFGPRGRARPGAGRSPLRLAHAPHARLPGDGVPARVRAPAGRGGIRPRAVRAVRASPRPHGRAAVHAAARRSGRPGQGLPRGVGLGI